MRIKNWQVLPLDKNEAARIASEYGLPHIVAMLLQIRGITARGDIAGLLEEGGFSESPFVLKDMDKAVTRIQKALDGFERIAVYGDYDADGITATSILYTYLESLGGDVMYYIPKREGEGYGMNSSALNYLKDFGVKLIITVDNGISSVKEVEEAAEIGMDVVITDHHRPQGALPKAVAVVDPHREDCGSVFKDYAGAGLALKLVMAMEDGVTEPGDVLLHYGDLAALGTIGDIVPITGENRVIVRAGLRSIEESDREGLIALKDKAGIEKITATTVAYSLVPRINATGRMGAPDRAVQLLTCDYDEDARALAEEICGDNEERRVIESRIVEEAIANIEADPRLKHGRVLVVSGEGWHEGVLGIVAARIMERYAKPTVIISTNGEEAKGSGRSFEGFSLFNAISACSQTILRFGGHHMAAGINLQSSSVEDFRRAMESYAAKSMDIMPAMPLNIDCKLMPGALSTAIPEQLGILEPFGSGNQYPLFGLYAMVLEGITPVGGGKHLRLSFRRETAAVNCMRFSCTAEEFPYTIGTVMDLAISLDAKEYRGAMNLSVIVRDMKPGNVDLDGALRSYRIYEKFLRGEELSLNERQELCPNREDFARIYRLLRGSGKSCYSALQLMNDLKPGSMELGRLMVCLDVLRERGLIVTEGDEVFKVQLVETAGKTDIFASPIITQLRVAE